MRSSSELKGVLTLKVDPVLERRLEQIEQFIQQQTNQLRQVAEQGDELESQLGGLSRSLGRLQTTIHNQLTQLQSFAEAHADQLEELAEKLNERSELTAKLLEERSQLKADWVFEEFLKQPVDQLIAARDTIRELRRTQIQRGTDEDGADSTQGGNAPDQMASALDVLDQQLLRVLRHWHIRPLDGDRRGSFNPETEEAIATESVSTPREDGIVLRQKGEGYRRNGALIRPRKVIVGQYHEETMKEVNE